MLEQAARALHASIRPGWDWDDPKSELKRNIYRENVRAVLRSLREADIGRVKLKIKLDRSAALQWRELLTAMIDERP